MPAVTLPRRRPGSTPQERADEAPITHDIATAAQHAGSTLAVKATTAVLLSALILGPAGFATAVWLLIRPAPAPAATTSPPPDQSPQRAAAGEYAQRLVAAWLQATTARTQAVDDLLADPVTPGSVPLTVRDLTVSSWQPLPADVWSVTVAATVTDDKNTTARRFYQVPVSMAGGVLTALSAPAPVPAPQTSTEAPLDYATVVNPSSPLGDTVAGFLSALLTADGDVSRYTTPSTSIRPITPAVYRTIDVDDVTASGPDDPAAVPADGETAQVLVVATGTVTSQQRQSLTYALTLTGRAGRWEVTAIDPSPLLDPTTSTDPLTDQPDA